MWLRELQFPKVVGGEKNAPTMRSERFYKWYKVYTVLEFCVLGSAGERDDIPNVLHSGNEEYEALKAQTESGVRA